MYNSEFYTQFSIYIFYYSKRCEVLHTFDNLLTNFHAMRRKYTEGHMCPDRRGSRRGIVVKGHFIASKDENHLFKLTRGNY